jgi:alanine racemase
MHSDSMRAWVRVDLGALRRNAARVAEHSRARLLPMVKADAYGLGAVRVARALEPLEPWGYGVATVREGEELRAAGITRPLVVFTPLREVDLDGAWSAQLTPALGDARTIARWAETGLPWQLAIDTGMHRAGVNWTEVGALRAAIEANPPEGAFTHFHSAELDDGSMEVQEQRFQDALAVLPAMPAMLHAENSAAALRRTPSRWTVVRPGIFLYGVGSGAAAAAQPEPVVTLQARIVELRTVPAGASVSYDATWTAPAERRIATLPVGYADGYRRALGNHAHGLMHGRRVPVVGVVTMDMTMVDVSGAPCEVGDVVTLLGSDGKESLDVAGVAASAEQSPYELLTGLRQRLPRIYVEDDA